MIAGIPQKPPSALQQTIDAVIAALTGLFTTPAVRAPYTGKTASIGSTALYVNAPSGYYRVSTYAVASNSVAGTLAVSIIFTDSVGAQTFAQIPATALLTGGALSGTTTLYTPGGTISFSTTRGGTLTYNIYLVVEKL